MWFQDREKIMRTAVSEHKKKNENKTDTKIFRSLQSLINKI